jgi:hypothetical protein
MAFLPRNASVALKSKFPLARYLSFITLILLALPLSIVAISEQSDEPILHHDGFLEVVSPDGATREQGRELAKQVRAAWNFDLSVMHWSHPEDMERPLKLRLVSHDRMKREHGGARATASSSGNKFTVDMNLIGDESIERTFAHELGHVQMFRVLGKYSEGGRVPHYFLEGHGQMLNQLYSDHLGQDASGPGARFVKTFMLFTADEAHEILTDPQLLQSRHHRGKRKENRQDGTHGLVLRRISARPKEYSRYRPKNGPCF